MYLWKRARKVLAVVSCLAMLMSLIPAASAANPVTVTFDQYSVLFSDVLFEEDVPLWGAGNTARATVRLYHVPASSTVSIRNDSDDRSEMIEDGNAGFDTQFGAYVGPNSIHRYSLLEDGGIRFEGLSNGSLPVELGKVISQTAEDWVRQAGLRTGKETLGIVFSGNTRQDVADIYFVADDGKFPLTSSGNQNETPTRTAAMKDSGSASISKLSKQEIVDLLNSAPLTMPDAPFVTAPSCTAPYSPGKVKTEVLDAAAARLSALRRVAGLPAVTADPALCEEAQYGAVLLAASEFSHYPAQPSDMDNSFYSKGKSATSSSNIYAGLPLTYTPDGFMDDSDGGNIDRLGHRRWQLNPQLGKVGFGYAVVNTGYRNYTAEKVFDRSGTTSDYNFIAWPSSGNFPNDLSAFEKNTAWSVTLNPSRYQTPSASSVSVTLTRESDGKSWSFSGRNSYQASGSGLYFNVETNGYGVNNCIIFRPDGIDKYEGIYTVTISGLSPKSGSDSSLSYQVDFFSSKDYTPTPTTPTTPTNPTTVTFSDVKSTDWFKTYVEKAATAGLINGTGNGKYEPQANLELAQAMVLAYQIDSKATGRTLPQASGAWYMPYYQYCLDNGIITASQVSQSDLTRKASRFEMVAILDKAVPADNLKPVKTVTSIPDLTEGAPYGATVYKWYRAGILSGDSEGRFNGGSDISRAEMAVILCQLNGL